MWWFGAAKFQDYFLSSTKWQGRTDDTCQTLAFTRRHAYSEACDKEVLVRVNGDGEETIVFRTIKGEDEESYEEVQDEIQDPEGLVCSPIAREGGNKVQVFKTFNWLVVPWMVTVHIAIQGKLEGEALSPNTHLCPLPSVPWRTLAYSLLASPTVGSL